MKYEIIYTKRYKKSIKRIDRADLKLVEYILEKLANDEILEPKYKDHALKGNLKRFRECHIKPDLLLVYEKSKKLLILKAIDIGNHNEIF